ncbi:N-acetyltransferase [Roseibium denhamense]|uniref:Protein N-acetyltransferase, RimJ/RimL family n=1 Tax=Roseibium denhamense TaxID=76305 RepID=A0ABY1PDF5_9HYPH|nr:GNAT family N-acetyltransferase [Roseibium denhamense]MTI05257.1 N-acetyltransferase [Roseibium denhamense]SMP30613.1 Protein N-acetyltransferase, RimJ/RimL family [Roseibium denhamense]
MSFPLGPFPACERLRFRLPSTNDAAFYLKLMNEPDYIRFIANHDLKTEEDALQYIKGKSLARFAQHKVGLWVVELKETGDPVGVCGLVFRKELEHPDLGYALLEKYRGRGFAREAATAVLEFAGKVLKLRTLCAITAPDNAASSNVLKKIGFEADGQLHLTEIGATADYYVWKLRYVEKGLA